MASSRLWQPLMFFGLWPRRSDLHTVTPFPLEEDLASSLRESTVPFQVMLGPQYHLIPLCKHPTSQVWELGLQSRSELCTSRASHAEASALATPESPPRAGVGRQHVRGPRPPRPVLVGAWSRPQAPLLHTLPPCLSLLFCEVASLTDV